MLQWNCRSIRDKHNELVNLITKYSPHVIALSETWLCSTSRFVLNGFTIARKDRPDGYGGVLIACREDLIASSIVIASGYESVGCSVKLKSGTQINIASVYFPPTPQISSPNLEAMIRCIPEPRFILGDFNAHGLQWGCTYDDQRAHILTQVLRRQQSCYA